MRQPCLNKFALFCKGRKLKDIKISECISQVRTSYGKKTSCNMFMYLKTGLHRLAPNSPKSYETTKAPHTRSVSPSVLTAQLITAQLDRVCVGKSVALCS